MNLGLFEVLVFIEIIVTTALILLMALHFIKLKALQVMAVFITLSYFFYSGYGIAYSYIDNRYGIKYLVFLFCMLLPFVIWGKNVKNRPNRVDAFMERSPRLLNAFSFLYLFCLFIPLVYPRFKLFDIFHGGFQGLIGFYDLHNEYGSNAIIGVVDTLALFCRPFFFINLTQIQIRKNTSKISLLLFLLSILFSFMRYGYLSRYQMVLYTLVLLFFLFSIKGYIFELKGKHLALFTTIAILSVPFLYAFTFIRQGDSVGPGLSYWDSMVLLIEGEVYYPTYYDHILSSVDLASQSAIGFVAWLFFLPIPSFFWPGKPRISPDAFTYSLTGKHITDAGYASSLPSLLGESFMFFGDKFYWVEALLIGCIMVLIIRYLAKYRTMTFYMVYLIVFSLTIGRGGASSYMSTIINGVVSVVIVEFLLYYSRRK